MPSVAVAVAVFTIESTKEGPRLSVLQHKSGSGWALPAVAVKRKESLATAALRAQKELLGLEGIRPTQASAHDDTDRDVVTVAYLDPIAHGLLRDAIRRPDVRLVAAGSPGRIAQVDLDMIKQAVAQLRLDYAETPDPAGLLPFEFTLRELLDVHGAITGEEVARDTFRRTMADRLKSAGRLSMGGPGRPAELFRRAR